jgi:peptidoglycan/LPS O-acetylase OafA/YrhL
MVWIVGDTPILKRFFEGPLAQYCGRISYAIYIMHGPVMGLCVRPIVGNVFIPASGEPGTPEFKEAVMARGIKGVIGISTTRQLTTGWVLGVVMVGAVVVWAADIFWRAVDDPIVKLGRRLEMYCVDDVEEKPRGRGYSQAV